MLGSITTFSGNMSERGGEHLRRREKHPPIFSISEEETDSTFFDQSDGEHGW